LKKEAVEGAVPQHWSTTFVKLGEDRFKVELGNGFEVTDLNSGEKTDFSLEDFNLSKETLI